MTLLTDCQGYNHFLDGCLALPLQGMVALPGPPDDYAALRDPDQAASFAALYASSYAIFEKKSQIKQTEAAIQAQQAPLPRDRQLIDRLNTEKDELAAIQAVYAKRLQWLEEQYQLLRKQAIAEGRDLENSDEGRALKEIFKKICQLRAHGPAEPKKDNNDEAASGYFSQKSLERFQNMIMSGGLILTAAMLAIAPFALPGLFPILAAGPVLGLTMAAFVAVIPLAYVRRKQRLHAVSSLENYKEYRKHNDNYDDNSVTGKIKTFFKGGWKPLQSVIEPQPGEVDRIITDLGITADNIDEQRPDLVERIKQDDHSLNPDVQAQKQEAFELLKEEVTDDVLTRNLLKEREALGRHSLIGSIVKTAGYLAVVGAAVGAAAVTGVITGPAAIAVASGVTFLTGALSISGWFGNQPKTAAMQPPGVAPPVPPLPAAAAPAPPAPPAAPAPEPAPAPEVPPEARVARNNEMRAARRRQLERPALGLPPAQRPEAVELQRRGSNAGEQAPAPEPAPAPEVPPEARAARDDEMRAARLRQLAVPARRGQPPVPRPEAVELQRRGSNAGEQAPAPPAAPAPEPEPEPEVPPAQRPEAVELQRRGSNAREQAPALLQNLLEEAAAQEQSGDEANHPARPVGGK